MGAKQHKKSSFVHISCDAPISQAVGHVEDTRQQQQNLSATTHGAREYNFDVVFVARRPAPPVWPILCTTSVEKHLCNHPLMWNKLCCFFAGDGWMAYWLVGRVDEW